MKKISKGVCYALVAAVFTGVLGCMAYNNKGEGLKLEHIEVQPKGIEVEYIPTVGMESGHIQVDVDESKLALDDSMLEAHGGVPSSYRSTYTAIENQQSTSLCWAFAATAAAEGSAIKKGILSSSADLSETHYGYFNYNAVTDPLGGTVGDKTNAIGRTWYERGGNNMFSTFSAVKWSGFTDETVAPFSTNGFSASIAYNSDKVHVQNVKWIPLANSTAVKNEIMKNGALTVGYCANDSFYNSNTYAQYCPVAKTANHDVTIVGWDDNYSKNNFLYTPAGNGAWLIKNSWSFGWGNDGLFWLSYYDKSLDSVAIAFDAESASNYEHNYQYDGSTGLGYSNLTNGSKIANIFTATKNGNGNYEKISAVGLGLYDASVKYSIQIYKNPTSTNPESGVAMLSTPQTGTTSYAGYTTIKLNKPVYIKKGEKFSVVITLNNSKYSTVAALMDKSYDQGWITFTTNQVSGQSFIKQNGYSWNDMISYGSTMRVKAYASGYNGVIPTAVSINKSSLGLVKGKTATLTATVAPSNATDKTVSWKSSNTSVVTVSNTGKVTAKKKGTATITATGAGGKTATCKVYVGASSATSIKLNKKKATVNVGKSVTLKGTIKPTSAPKAIIWTSSDKTIANVSSNGKVTTYKPGKVTITAKTHNGKKAQCTLTITPKKVSGLALSTPKAKAVKLTWTKQNGVTGYEVYYSTKKKSSYKKLGTTTSNTVTKTGLKAKKKYYFKVRSYKKIGNKKMYGSFSGVKSIKIK